MSTQAEALAASRLPPERLAVSAAFLGNGFVVGSWAPQIPVLANRLSLSESVLGLVILVFGIGAVVAMPLVGRFIAGQGSRRPMLVLNFLSAAALALVVLAPNLSLAACAVLFYGATIGGTDVAMNANAVSVEKRMPQAIMSSCHGFWSVGGLAGSASGGLLIAAFGALGHALLVGAFVLAFGLMVLFWSLDDRPAAGDAADGHHTAGASREGRSGTRDWRAIAKAVAIGILALFTMIPEGAAIDWSAIYLRQELGAGIAISGFAFAAFSATMAVLRFLGDPLRDRLGAVLTVRLSSLVGASGLLLIGFAPTTAVALAGFALMGIGLSNMVPIAFSAAGNLEGMRPGVALGIVTTLGYSGILVAPSVIGVAAEHVGFAAVFAGMSALLVVTLAGAGLLRGADRPKGRAR